MEIGEWIESNLGNFLSLASQVEVLEANKNIHVVGECHDCRYWGKTLKLPEGLPPEAIKDLEGTHRECESEDSSCAVTPKDYGCVHFKPKQDETAPNPSNCDEL